MQRDMLCWGTTERRRIMSLWRWQSAKHWSGYRKFKLHLSFTAPQELIKCMLSFDVVLCLLTLLMREVPGAAVTWIMLLTLPGPPVSARRSMGCHAFISSALIGKKRFKSQLDSVWPSTCDKQSSDLVQTRESPHCTHADPPATPASCCISSMDKGLTQPLSLPL